MACRALLIFIVIFFWCVSAYAQTTSGKGRGSVAFFASERISGDWTDSYFSSIPRGEPRYNQCEEALGQTLAGQGYSGAGTSFSDAQRLAAKRLNAVFKRYNDVSAIPNDTAARAAAVVDSLSPVVLACRAVVEKPGWRARGRTDSCANARCKAVDTKTRRRIATASGMKCRQADDRNAAGVAAIREVCSEMATQLGGKLITHKISMTKSQ